MLLNTTQLFGHRHNIWGDLTEEKWTRVLELEISGAPTDHIHSERDRVRRVLFNDAPNC